MTTGRINQVSAQPPPARHPPPSLRKEACEATRTVSDSAFCSNDERHKCRYSQSELNLRRWLATTLNCNSLTRAVGHNQTPHQWCTVFENQIPIKWCSHTHSYMLTCSNPRRNHTPERALLKLRSTHGFEIGKSDMKNQRFFQCAAARLEPPRVPIPILTPHRHRNRRRDAPKQH